ncbi:hypothetical protein ACWC0C_10660 [Streptomyces sp. NPDC001709]
MSVPTRRRRWFTVCALTPSAASGRSPSPFGVSTLGQLAHQREQSVGTMAP